MSEVIVSRFCLLMILTCSYLAEIWMFYVINENKISKKYKNG